MSEKPSVAIIGTGGTIGSTGFHSLDLVEYRGPMVEIDALIAQVPELDQYADVITVEHSTVASDAITVDDWLSLSRLIDHTVSEHPGLSGVVVTHGTATLEETAYFLNLTLRCRLPVVLVGAQRPATGLSSDTRMNLLSAVRTAVSEGARGQGVLVVLNETIQAAREVTKSSVFRLDAFRTPDFGVLGHTDLDVIHWYRHVTRRHTYSSELGLDDETELPRVDIVPSYAGADGVAVDAFVAAGAVGLVVGSLAPGTAPPVQTEALTRAVSRGVAVVYSSRAGGGRVLDLPHGQASGSITADNLSPQKARVLLMLALRRTSETAALKRFFDEY